jgi:SAM-dependent methyltransferase
LIRALLTIRFLMKIPYGDEMFDIVFSDNVLEHLEFPENVFSEVSRVLKPGGVFLFKTPNKYHYMPLIASVTPTSFHQLVNKWRGRAEVDIFPTQYRANCVRDIQRLAKVAHFTPQKLELIEGRPEYASACQPISSAQFISGWSLTFRCLSSFASC